MTVQQFQDMMNRIVRPGIQSILECPERKRVLEFALDDVMDDIIYTYFWNYETDMPTCKWNQMRQCLVNTYKQMERRYCHEVL